MDGIALVVFDMAGTTINDEDSVNRCLRESLEAYGLSVTRDEVNAVMGIRKPDAIAILVKQKGRLGDLGERLDEIHQNFVARSIDFYRKDPTVHEIPGVSRAFEILKQAGIRVALNTGFDRTITDVLLERLGWSGNALIDATISSDEVPRGRPFPDMIQELMRRMEIQDPKRVAKVGDTPADLEEGKNAGCGFVIGVTRGTHSREQLEQYEHTHLIETVADLPSQLGLVGA